jgi:rod shape-determining protein MreC
MIKYLREYRFQITLFLFLLIPVIAIDTSTRAPRDYRFYDRAIVFVTAPIQGAVSWSLEEAVSFFQNYVYLWHVRRDNEAVLEENRRLQNQIAALRESQQENLRLRKLLEFEEKHSLDSVVARVIAKDASSEFRAVRINRGEASGIRKDMAVVTHEGIVGRILRTSRDTADVVTVLDPLSGVDAINERSRARGVMEGMSEELCALRYTLRTDDIQPGDVLITSGLGGIFPKGLPLGVVSKVNRKPFGITQEVEVRPSVDFKRLEEVMVITRAEGKALIPDEAAPARNAAGANEAAPARNAAGANEAAPARN